MNDASEIELRVRIAKREKRVDRLSAVLRALFALSRLLQPDLTRRIAGRLARLGVKVSRSSVQRILRHGPRNPIDPEDAVTASVSRTLLAKRPNHVGMIDFTRIGSIFQPLWVGAVINAYSRRVLAIGAIRGAPTEASAVLLFRRAIPLNGSPRWLVSDQDPVLRGGLVQRLLTRRDSLRRYGAVGKSGSIGLIERFLRPLKEEYVNQLFPTARPRRST